MILGNFDHAFLINLDRRPERLEHATEQLNSMGIPFERFAAIEVDTNNGLFSPGAHGCRLSHLACIQLAKERGYESVLLIEDDIVFRDQFLALWKDIEKPLQEADWDIFYAYDWLNRNQISPPYNICLRKAERNTGTHFWAIHSRFYDKAIETILRQEAEGKDIPVDAAFAHVKGHFHRDGAVWLNDGPDCNLYVTNFNLVGQQKNQSDTRSRWQYGADFRYSGDVYWSAG